MLPGSDHEKDLTLELSRSLQNRNRLFTSFGISRKGAYSTETGRLGKGAYFFF